MAVHNFGIMDKPPQKSEIYETFEPEKYNCISVSDDYIEPILSLMCNIEFFYNTLNIKEKGLNYCGITLISPSSSEKMLSVIENNENLKNLTELLKKAVNKNKYVIHFGIWL